MWTEFGSYCWWTLWMLSDDVTVWLCDRALLSHCPGMFIVDADTGLREAALRYINVCLWHDMVHCKPGPLVLIGDARKEGDLVCCLFLFFFSFFLFWRWEGWGTLFTRSHFPPTPHPHPTILLTTCSVCSFPLPAGLLVYCHRCHSLVRPQRIWTSSLIPCHLHDPVVTVWV